jgi:hypothetical protein
MPMDSFEQAQRRMVAILASCLARAIRRGDSETVEECRRLLAGEIGARVRHLS